MLTLPDITTLDELARLRDLLDSLLKAPTLMMDVSKAELQRWREQHGGCDCIVGDFKITKIRKTDLDL